MPTENEIWRPIPGHLGYEASDQGRIRSFDRWVQQTSKNGSSYKRFIRGRVLSQHIDGAGYPAVEHGRVHILVMLAFNGTPSIDMETAHADGDKSNVRLSNLRYATRQENEKDKLLHGTHNRGARHGMSKLTEQDVLTIRQVIGQTQTALAKRFGVSDSCIRAILSRQRWAWL